eukprot:NODE_417_length_1580_cov_284.460984.p1 GENE.NODE_417_length_1580_cov_284.460984~~NODE_417_length_1580_cov_284.460984.p1  ORF type:complete len:298 (-),score=74.79 NODE_417_length_1580_cov_284.460984:372-1265(-)
MVRAAPFLQDNGSDAKRLRRILAPFFTAYDTDCSKSISFREFRFLVKDLGVGLTAEVKDFFDKSATSTSHDEPAIDFNMFVECVQQVWQHGGEAEAAGTTPMGSRKTQAAVWVQDDDEEPEEEELPADLADKDPAEQQKLLKRRAFTLMFLGTALVLVFSDPMCDMLGVWGKKLGVSSFYVSFVLAPLASNASELIAAMRLASKKTKASMVNALSSLEGAAIMNNTFCLGIFMFLIVLQNLAWKFSAETLAILLVELLVGMFVCIGNKQTLAHGIVIFLCYPLSLVVVVLLEAAGLD